MIATPTDLPAALADAIAQYEATGNVGALMERLHHLRDGVTPDALVAAAEPVCAKRGKGLAMPAPSRASVWRRDKLLVWRGVVVNWVMF